MSLLLLFAGASTVSGHDGTPDHRGGRIVAGTFTRGQWRDVERKLAQESEQERRRRRREELERQREAALNQLERAERDLAKAIEARDAAARAVLDNFAQHRLEAFRTAEDRVANLQQRVAEIRADFELERARVAAEKARAEKAAQAARERDEARRLSSERGATDAEASRGAIERTAATLQGARLRSDAMRAIEKRQAERLAAEQQDEDEALTLLLLHE